MMYPDQFVFFCELRLSQWTTLRYYLCNAHDALSNASHMQVMPCNSATTVARRCTPFSYRRAVELHAVP